MRPYGNLKLSLVCQPSSFFAVDLLNIVAATPFLNIFQLSPLAVVGLVRHCSSFFRSGPDIRMGGGWHWCPIRFPGLEESDCCKEEGG